MGSLRGAVITIIPLLLSSPSFALEEMEAARQPLPEPLTLAFALAVADGSSPRIDRLQARIEGTDARRLAIEAESDAEISLEAGLWAIEPSESALDRSRNDSRVALRLRKQLYDFGRSEAALQASLNDRRSNELNLLDARRQWRIEIMECYFNVLLADLRYIRDNEVMTMAYLRWDKSRKRGELGQVSDILLLEQESEFQRARRERQESENLQRATRFRLANVLNRPGELSSDLEIPGFDNHLRMPGEVEPLIGQALERNPRLQALRAGVQAAGEKVRAEQAADGPLVRAEMEAAAYARETGSRHPASAGLVFELPLSTGERNRARVAEQVARQQELRAELAAAELDIRQAVLDLWLEIRALRIEREEVAALGNYRDLYLSRSRALYDLEVHSDLGDAESAISDFRLRSAQVEFRLALAWARLDALTGNPLQTGVPAGGGER